MSELDILRHEIEQLQLKLEAMTLDRNQWKANHADAVKKKRISDEYKEDFRSRAVVAERRVVELEAQLEAARRDPGARAIVDKFFPKGDP